MLNVCSHVSLTLSYTRQLQLFCDCITAELITQIKNIYKTLAPYSKSTSNDPITNDTTTVYWSGVWLPRSCRFPDPPTGLEPQACLSAPLPLHVQPAQSPSGCLASSAADSLLRH